MSVDDLFGHTYMVRRWRQAPLYGKRVAFLKHLLQLGYARGTVKVMAYSLLTVIPFFPLEPKRQIRRSEIVEVAARWARRRVRAGRASSTIASRAQFIRVAQQWFTFLGRLEKQRNPSAPFATELADFQRWMLEERGLAPASIETFTRQVLAFLRWLKRRRQTLRGLSARDVDAYFSSEQCRRLSRKSLVLIASALRCFFRHAQCRGWCSADIAAGIDRPVVYRHAGLPQGPTWPQVWKLIASTTGNKPTDLRSRAIFLLLATYGLRMGEIIKLTLDDLDWDRELIRVRRGKGRRLALYPMTPEVGVALSRYVSRARPVNFGREVFLTLVAPVRPLCRSAFGRITARRFKRLDIRPPRGGPHSLRHACATHLVQQGASFKAIADQLGHRSLMTTGIYAKVDLKALRQVADFDLKGVVA